MDNKAKNVTQSNCKEKNIERSAWREQKKFQANLQSHGDEEKLKKELDRFWTDSYTFNKNNFKKCIISVGNVLRSLHKKERIT